MNLHQVLTGACNAGDHGFAVGSVEGVPFTAYAAGCDIVILSSTFERVQIIPGVCHGNIQVVCLDCSTDRGKIAVAYGCLVAIFEPTPTVHQNKSNSLDYCWVQTGSFVARSKVHNLSWNLEGTRLLSGGECIQMWQYIAGQEVVGSNNMNTSGVHFQIGGEDGEDDMSNWQCIWQCKTASPIFHLKFSPDGALFASAGKADRLVKVWYEYKPVSFPNKNFDTPIPNTSSMDTTMEDVRYSFIYIAHPRAVTGLSWRKTSKFMPRGSVSNMLVTSCRDNICRLWVQTVLPDDGLVNMQQFDQSAGQSPKYRMSRHKHKFMVRLKHMKTCFHFRRRHGIQQIHHNGPLTVPIPSLPSTLSSHDFHSFGIEGTGVTHGFHFHLAASINAETDIPLVPSIRRRDRSEDPNFVLHWLNNKEMQFTLCAEQILQDLCKKAVIHDNTNQSAVDEIEFEAADDSHELEDVDSNKEESVKKKIKKQKVRGLEHKAGLKSKGVEDMDEQPCVSPVSHVSSVQTSVSSSSISTDPSLGMMSPLGDTLDRRIEALLRDWHQNPDLLFSVHPVDGSFLVWLVDWLDEYTPGTYRQAQVSFSSRIPNALPLGDATTMSTSLTLYNCKSKLDLKTVLDIDSGKPDDDNAEIPTQEGDNESLHNLSSKTRTEFESPFSNSIFMLSKHDNGTLNLWNLTFNENSKFTLVLSVGHQARVCGHRFRVNDITCHPVLPLLLTTSHHNLPKPQLPVQSSTMQNGVASIPEGQPFEDPLYFDNCATYEEQLTHTGFCSELILWRVDPVGPLCRSGGITELARINSPEICAFANVAWIPTLLPSTTLGSISNSPSACFIASDGVSLRVYQAVIDARTLLGELSSAERKNKFKDCMGSQSSSSSVDIGMKSSSLEEKFHIISQQSTARPGCVIQLDSIADANHDWYNTQLLHVFQEQLITGERSGGEDNSNLLEPSMSAIVDLRHLTVFEEPFYLVVIEKNNKLSVLHMWKIVIASQPVGQDFEESLIYAPDSDIIQEGENSSCSSRSSTPDVDAHLASQSLASPVSITTTKVCMQTLVLPEDVEIVHAAPAAGHLSSSSIYPACLAPYLICTACSDSCVRFWRCSITAGTSEAQTHQYKWMEWEMHAEKEGSSEIDLPGSLLNVSCAYSGRIACAYKHGKSFTRPQSDNPSNRFVNLCVAIYECESTGGTEWALEDTIHLRNIGLPENKFNFDLRYIYDESILKRKKQSVNNLVRTLSHEEVNMSSTPKDGADVDPFFSNLHGLVAVPSFSTLQTLRKTICEKGNQSLLTQKHLVQLDWVSTEDGSHVLTVGVGSKVLLFTAVGSDIAQANLKAMKESRSGIRPILKKASSMVVPLYSIEEVRWMKVRSVTLKTADGLPPLPMQISWVRDGILVIGMDNEMHVYSQWKSPGGSDEPVAVTKLPDLDDSIDNRTLTDQDLLSLVHESSHHRILSTKSLTHMSSPSIVGAMDLKKKRELITKGIVNVDSSAGVDIMPDYGLFEASSIACPVLPQYHPKQLMELLNFGKIPRVKAILSHVVNCLAGSDVMQPRERIQSRITNSSTSSATAAGHQRSWSRSRTMSISVPTRISPMDQQDTQMQSAIVSEEVQLDYVEINAIPPLPLFTLLNADRETYIPASLDVDRSKAYSGLFDGLSAEPTESLDDILARGMVGYDVSDQRHTSSERQALTIFGPRQARILTQILTHAHLPGLSSLDQMHLLALADTVATFNSEISDKFTLSSCKEGFTQNAAEMTNMVATDALDDCGLRFLLAMRHQSYLLRCVPIFQRAQLQKQGMSPANLVWAFHSEAEDELLNMIPGIQRGNPRWSELKELGVVWWVRSNSSLRKCIEKVAKAAFQAHNDPMDAALFYLAMKKKNVLWGLFRSVQDSKMAAFFQHNFEEDRWRKAALKNAFALLGKQRFEQAASFFLLAGALQDAIEVCLTKLDDLQLAMTIIRLYEGDMDACPPSLCAMLYQQILGSNIEGSFQASDAHPDPFLRSMTYWLMKDYSSALSTLLQTEVGSNHPKAIEDDLRSFHSILTNPNVFNFYLYLRTHPLLVRQKIAESVSSTKHKKGVTGTLSGFYHGCGTSDSDEDGQVLLEETITSLERRLYFTTAHAHFKAGCPALALEVLSRLPNKVINTSVTNSCSTSISSPIKTTSFESCIKSGTLETLETSDLDWSKPIFMQSKIEEKLELDFDVDISKFDEKSSMINEKNKVVEVQSDEAAPQLDIMAQQLKFIACLKIVMEELSTLATGFEVDGGQLRYQLYIWLEQEVGALREICNYGMPQGSIVTSSAEVDKSANVVPSVATNSGECPTLHEILMADKLDFEAKLHRAERRKHWLKANQTLLRTLLTYCCLHGASGGGLASVRMELILLLQELHQEKTPRQLLSPLPFPTTLPLLSASVACHKTVVTDPIRHLQSMTHDILQTIVALVGPPIPGCINCAQVFILRDLSIALAACIYQSLCDSDSFSVKQSGYLSAGMEALASASVVYHNSHLMAGQSRRRRFSSSEDDLQATTSPNKWPGVTSLRALLSREKDEDAPKLTTLLCEAFVAVYMSLLVHSLATCEAHTLFRLVGQSFSEKRWATLFGGGAKRLLKVSMNGSVVPQLPLTEKLEGGRATETGLLNTLSKQRQRLHMKLFAQGTQPVPIKDDRPTYREKFIPPEISMVSCFMTKPVNTDGHTEYDSSESIPSEEDEDIEEDDNSDDAFKRSETQTNEVCTEHSDPNSYSWCILRYAIVSLSQRYIQSFLSVAGMELQELPVASPLIHSVQRIFDHWLNVLKEVLDSKGGPPVDYIPGCTIEKGRLPSHKYATIQNPQNVPFKSRHQSVQPVRRLWLYLVRQEHTHEIFVRYIFLHKRFRPQPMVSADDMSTTITNEPNNEHAVADPIRIIHKDQDSISAFCISQTNIGIVTLATNKEMQELDISVLLEPPSWLEDECEYDLLNMSKGIETLPAAEYLVVQTAADRPMLAHLNSNSAQPGSTASSAFNSPTGSVPSPFVGQTGRATTVFKGLNVPGASNPHFCQFILERSHHLINPMMKHRIEGVRRISAHPLLPIYVSGSQDGSVRLWEWGHKDPLTMPRPPGAYAKVTRVRFNSQGNKVDAAGSFGVSNGDGNLSLWQVGVGSSASKAFFTVQCHTKQTSDFAFVASSSLIATAGHSSESRNVCIWDTLLPQKKALVHAFVCHDQGSSCVVYAPQHQYLISAGKKGFINIFDVRQRQPRHRFQAHESAIKCLALDPAEEYFATGSADGDIKIWGLTVHTMFLSFPGEHVRNSFFRNLSMGVTQLHIDDNNRLFSCGADGSMKLRHLPERDLVLPYY